VASPNTITAEGATFLDERQLAVMLGLSVLTLQKWRYLRKGPPHQKLGTKAVRYPLSGLMRWLESETVSAADPQREVR
jgi:predicted DNA-binding transcriptional regulator AlpA